MPEHAERPSWRMRLFYWFMDVATIPLGVVIWMSVFYSGLRDRKWKFRK